MISRAIRLTEEFGRYFTINKTFSEAEKQLKGYDAVYCAGGRGLEYIRTDKRVQAIVRHFHDEPERKGRIVGAPPVVVTPASAKPRPARTGA